MNLLTAVLAKPELATSLDAAAWNTLLQQARGARLLARLRARLKSRDENLSLPTTVEEVFRGADIYVRYLQQRARHEISALGKLAAECPYPIVLLKGAAYLLQDAAAAAGRSLSDIDVLVPRKHLDDFEARLLGDDWEYSEHLSDYDHRYYRDYAHELPPLLHPDMQFELDVHHNILQPTHRLKVAAGPLIERAERIPNTPFYALCPADQILHSATHLTMSDELRGGLRDLTDIWLLFEQGVNADPGFAETLVHRAFAVGLGRPLYYVIDCAAIHLGLRLPTPAQERLDTAAPPIGQRQLMRALICRQLADEAGKSRTSGLRSQMLYLRSHWIRMPPGVLVSHALRKSLPRPPFLDW